VSFLSNCILPPQELTFPNGFPALSSAQCGCSLQTFSHTFPIYDGYNMGHFELERETHRCFTVSLDDPRC